MSSETHAATYREVLSQPAAWQQAISAVIGLLSNEQRSYEIAVLEEMKALGGYVISVGESDTDIIFNSGLPEAIRNVLYLPALQLMAYYRSLAKGLNPDRPNNLTAVVELDLSDM